MLQSKKGLPRILTGDRPTGLLHLGHLCGSLQNRVLLEKDHDQFIMIADLQTLTDNFEKSFALSENVFSIMLDYLSVGLDPEKNTFFVQSALPELTQLTVIFLNLVTVSRLERNPTIKTEIAMRGFANSIPAGFLVYPISQAADIVAFDAEFVPVGQDQVPLIEQCCEIVDKFNTIFGQNILVRPKAVVVQNEGSRLVGLDGQAKMSKSLNNAIFLSDSTEVVRQKVMQMYTDKDHIKITDPGKVQGNVVFTFLDVFCPDKTLVQSLKDQYTAGGLGDVKLKNILIEVLEVLLEPIRQRRKVLLSASRSEIYKILIDGNARAREIAQQTYSRVVSAMKLNYF